MKGRKARPSKDLPARTTPTPTFPRRLQAIFNVQGETEGDKHGSLAALETLVDHLRKDADVQQIFVDLEKQHREFFANGLGNITDQAHREIQTALDRLVMRKLGSPGGGCPFGAIAGLLYVEFLRCIINLQIGGTSQSRLSVGPTLVPLSIRLQHFPQHLGETDEAYLARTKPTPIPKGRKPRNQANDIKHYVAWFYKNKWCSQSQRSLSIAHQNGRNLTGDHRAHIRTGIARVSSLLAAIDPDMQVLIAH